MDKIRILYISYDGMTDSLGESQVIAYLKRICNYGFDIDIISYEKPDSFTKKRHSIEKQISGLSLNWYPLQYSKNPPVFSTMYDLASGWRKIVKLHKKHKYDIVHCRGYVPAFLGQRLKRKFGVKFIFDMRGWWADEKIESGLWNSSLTKNIYNYVKSLEKSFFAESDSTVSLTHCGKEEIVKNNWKEPDNIGVISTCVDFEVFHKFDYNIRNEVRTELGISKDAKVLLYSGSIGGNYGIENFFKIYKWFNELYPNSNFIILSKTDPAFINQYLDSIEINREAIKILSVDYSQVHKYLMAADVGLIIYELTYSIIGRCPTKLGEYWACGLPVLSIKGIGDLDNIISQYPRGGVLANDFSETSIKDSLIRLESFTDKEYLRLASKDYFDIQRGVDFYVNLYKALTLNTKAIQN